MATNTIQKKPKLQKILTLITLTLAALMILIPAAFIWHSQTTLEDGHLTHLGAVVRTWMSNEPDRKTWIGDFKSMNRVINDKDLTMTPLAAEYLARSSGGLLRIGQVHVSEDIAMALSKFRRGLCLHNLEDPSEETLRAFVSGSLYCLFITLPNPTPKDAAILGQFKERFLAVYEIGHLSPASAKAFVQSTVEEITLSGLDQLSGETAEELSKSKSKKLTITKLKTLSKEAAIGLSKFEGLYLTISVKRLSDEAAEALNKYPNNLRLINLKEISETAARTLAAREFVSFSASDMIGSSLFSTHPDSIAAILKERNRKVVIKTEEGIKDLTPK